MEIREKRQIMMRYAICLNRLIAANKNHNAQPKTGRRAIPSRVTSLRKLEASSGISFPIIQSISKGKKNPALTTIIAIADGLGITILDFFSTYNAITDAEVDQMLAKVR